MKNTHNSQVVVINGVHWGDEGKGKIVDLLARQFNVVPRYQGGPNAGHTVIDGTNKYVFHQLPSGILSPTTINILGNGMLVNLLTLQKEIGQLPDALRVGLKGRLFISNRAHLITPWLIAVEMARKKQLGEG